MSNHSPLRRTKHGERTATLVGPFDLIELLDVFGNVSESDEHWNSLRIKYASKLNDKKAKQCLVEARRIVYKKKSGSEELKAKQALLLLSLYLVVETYYEHKDNYFMLGKAIAEELDALRKLGQIEVFNSRLNHYIDRFLSQIIRQGTEKITPAIISFVDYCRKFNIPIDSPELLAMYETLKSPEKTIDKGGIL